MSNSGICERYVRGRRKDGERDTVRDYVVVIAIVSGYNAKALLRVLYRGGPWNSPSPLPQKIV